VMTLQSVSAATFFLTEVPTGYFSDRFKRKWAMICAALIRIVSVLSLMRAQNFHDLVVFEILFALSLCFDSGTDTAILYDTSEELKSTSGEPELGSSGLLSNRVFYLQIGVSFSRFGRNAGYLFIEVHDLWQPGSCFDSAFHCSFGG